MKLVWAIRQVLAGLLVWLFRPVRSWAPAAVGVCTVVAVVVSCCLVPFLSSAQPANGVPVLSKLYGVPAQSPPLGRVIRVGLQIKNIYDLDLPSQSFLADGWFWMSWGDDVQRILEDNQIQPSGIVEFTNEIDPSNYSFIQVIDEPLLVSPEMTHSYYARFSKKFYINEISQKYAPFDDQRLPIEIEVLPRALSDHDPSQRVELLPFPVRQFPIAGEYSSMIGFRLTATNWLRQLVYYGQPNLATYSRATAVFTFSPRPSTVFLKWFLPLVVVMGIVVLVPSINGFLGDARIAIVPAALLTLVILHENYRSNFPPAPYLTFLDEIYAYSYVACFVIFVVTLAGSNLLCDLRPELRKARTRLVRRWDAIAQVSIVVGFFVVSVLAWYD